MCIRDRSYCPTATDSYCAPPCRMELVAWLDFWAASALCDSAALCKLCVRLHVAWPSLRRGVTDPVVNSLE
eukprot:3894785-Amphidinium_carterae.1